MDIFEDQKRLNETGMEMNQRRQAIPRLAINILIASLTVSCTNKSYPDPKSYADEIEKWKTHRIETLRARDGWLNLAGLYWLKPGKNTFGSDSSSDVVFPPGKIAANAGFFLLEKDAVTLFPSGQSGITHNGAAFQQLVQFAAGQTQAVEAAAGSLRWTIIKRDTLYGVRLRDDESDLLKTFEGVERFPTDIAWRVTATLKKAGDDQTIPITNVLGQTTDEPSPGTLEFELKGKQCRLDVLDGKHEYFVILADSTTGNETYGGGRFLYVKKPGWGEELVVDFNKAINPPCVFTPYATCPLPPKQNRLPIAITAGEKTFGEHY